MFRKLFGSTRPNATSLSDFSFAVVDVETTGLFPTKHDRVIEVAVVRLDGNGDPLDEFATLVNPERDIGPTRIHGISTRDVLGAPLFREVAGDITERLAGAALVAHNARFDCDFLSAEFARLGEELPRGPVICTLNLARQTIRSVSSYKLGALCGELGIRHDDRHTALGDARATGALLKALLPPAWRARRGNLADLGCDQTSVPPISAWPRFEPSGKRHARNASVQQEGPSFLASLASRLPAAPSTHSAAAVEYVDLLDRVLEDRRVTAEEAGLLFETATRWGLSQDDVRLVHRNYLISLVELALEDGIITDSELSDLRDVSAMLGYDAIYLNELISDGAQRPMEERTRRGALSGLSVCFTGESICSRNGVPINRSDAEQLATAAGLRVQPSVTKKLDILVLADPDSLSGKTRTARRYGTRLIAEPVFWREIGVAID